MGNFVLFTVVTMHLAGRQVLGAITFDGDLSRIIGMGPPKRWLVFMDSRIQRCMGIYQHSAKHGGDLISVIHCLVIRQKPPNRCYYSQNSHDFYLIISHHILQFKYFYRVIPRASCQKQTTVDARILVHNSFHINFTVTSFADPRYHASLYKAQCYKRGSIFIVSFGIHSEEICGIRYPWRMYIPVNQAEVRIRSGGEYSHLSFVNIIGEVEVMDHQFILRLRGSRNEDHISWGNFKVYQYFITVEMLFRIRLSALTGSKVIIYDGPRLQMHQLSPYEEGFNQSHYISSTFQVIVVYVSVDENFTSEVKYNKDDSLISRKLTAPEQILVTNNSGCGNNNIFSWMCTFNVISLRGTQASVKITQLDIVGPFADTHLSAGVAIYNVINNAAHLVLHLFYKYNLHIPLSVTASENELYISVYAYSPYAFLSLKFIAQVNHCIGIFIGKNVRPSVAPIPHITEREYFGNKLYVDFHITLDIISHCYIIHINFLPTEPIQFKYTFYTHFQTCNFLRLHYNPYGISVVDLDFANKIYNGERHHSLYKFIDDKCQFSISFDDPSLVSHFVTTVKVTETGCLQPCRFTNITKVNTGRISEMCNMCKYLWLHHSMKSEHFMTKPNEFITFEHIQGSRSLRIWLTSLSASLPDTYENHYSMHAFTFRSPSSRKLCTEIEQGELWRIRRASLDKDEMNVIDEQQPARVNIYDYKGGYEYITVVLPPDEDGYRELTNWLFYAIQCSKYDATFLTIHDYQELRFIVKSIMHPFLIERVYISKSHMYKVWV